MRKTVAWQRVAEYFNEKSQVKVTGEQCCNKWKKHEEKFKKVQEHNERTGSDRKDMGFQEKLAEFLAVTPKSSHWMRSPRISTSAFVTRRKQRDTLDIETSN